MGHAAGMKREAGDALETIVLGSVAITTRAIVAVAPDLTLTQWRVLVIVGSSPDGATMSRIADRLGAELSPASRLVGRLVRRGLLGATKDPQDRRVTRVTMTDLGAEMRRQVFSRRQAMLERILADLVGIRDADWPLLDALAAQFAAYV